MDDSNVEIPENVDEVAHLKVSVLNVDGVLMPSSIIVTHDDLTIEGWNMLMNAYDDVDVKLQKTAQDIQKELKREQDE